MRLCNMAFVSRWPSRFLCVCPLPVCVPSAKCVLLYHVYEEKSEEKKNCDARGMHKKIHIQMWKRFLLIVISLTKTNKINDVRAQDLGSTYFCAWIIINLEMRHRTQTIEMQAKKPSIYPSMQSSLWYIACNCVLSTLYNIWFETMIAYRILFGFWWT